MYKQGGNHAAKSLFSFFSYFEVEGSGRAQDRISTQD